MTALVFDVNFAATSSGDAHRVCGSTSQKTGLAPRYIAALAVLHHVRLGQTTSSPADTPAVRRDRNSAHAHELTGTPCGAPTNASSSSSTGSVWGPMPIHPERST